MNIELTPLEARVIGCLIEKAITTPDQYPLSLNSLTTACNQKSNREPVMNLDDATVQETVDSLMKKHFVSEASGFGSRVVKYKHRFCNSEFGGLQLSEQELGILCVMMLRGPQTPGELRTRTNRLCKFTDVHETETVLETLISREDGPFVVKLPREPGRRESRYAHLLSGEVDLAAFASTSIDTSGEAPALDHSDRERIAQLEQDVQALREELAALKQQVGNPAGE